MFRKPKLKTMFKKTLADKIRELAQQITNHLIGHKRLIPVTVASPRNKKR